MNAISLFPEPFDLDSIEQVLREDDFLSLAFVVVGRKDNWRAALDQTAKLLSLFEDADRDHQPIYRMVSVLIQRASVFDDTGALLEEITQKLGLLSQTAYMEEIKMAHLHKTDPQAAQREINRKWAENYRANRDALRSAAVPRS